MIPPNGSLPQQFLSAATWYLACRLRVMGGDVLGCDIPRGDLGWSLLGMVDWQAEMRMIVEEMRRG